MRRGKSNKKHLEQSFLLLLSYETSIVKLELLRQKTKTKKNYMYEYMKKELKRNKR